ncbi:hypothetical protein T12_12113 [Trichinella patagoniensis]|uniref:Uncharacterized protein n=1 Tax=Trichinella patagoniensis TaxID=990121 RepID=A0A0V1AAA9_9BILA|nr:hypothetical protein T12_12113 [Trichinella patagoniensis]
MVYTLRDRNAESKLGLLNPQVEQMISTFLSYAPDLTFEHFEILWHQIFISTWLKIITRMDLAVCQRFHYVREKEKDNSSCVAA